MYDDQDATFLSISIFDRIDLQVTNNRLTVKSMSIKNGTYDPSPPLLNFRIFNIDHSKSIIPGSISLRYDQLYNYLNTFQKDIYSKLGDIIKRVSSDTNEFQSFECLTNKSKIRTTVLNKMENGGLSVSLSIIPKGVENKSGISYFMSLTEYISLVQLLKQYQNNNYLNYCIKFVDMHQSNTIYDTLNSVSTNVQSLNSRITAIQKLLESNPIQSSVPVIPSKSSKPKVLLGTDEVVLDLEVTSSSSDSVETKTVELSSSTEKMEVVGEGLQNDLSEFITDNIDKMDIGVNESSGDVFKHPEPVVTKLVNNPSSPLMKLIENDIIKFEQLMTNLSLEINPLQSFIDLINTKSDKKYIYCDIGFSFLEIISSLDLKRGLNNHLQNKIKIPSISPILIEPGIIDKHQMNLAIELFVFFSFYSHITIQLKEKDFNTTNNKELVSFVIKEVTSPLIFSYIPKSTDKTILKQLVSESYDQMKKAGVFDSLIVNIQETYNLTLKVSPVAIANKTEEIHKKITSNRDVLTLRRTLSRLNKNKIVFYPTPKDIITNYNTEQIKKIILLNISYLKSGAVNIKELKQDYKLSGFSDLPNKVIESFGINGLKHSNDNLKRLIKTDFKDDPRLDEYLGICDKVNISYRDLKGVDIDIGTLPGKVLKAILLWDIELMPLIEKQYIYYKNLVNESNLDDSMVLSMLKNIDDKIDSNFINSLTAATKELGV